MGKIFSHFVRFVVGDLSFVSALIGHYGAFNGMYRSPICEATKDEFGNANETCPLRKLDTIRQQAEQFTNKWTSTTKGTAQTKLFQETKGIRWAPLMNVPIENFVPSPFHCIQGVY